MGSLSDPTNFGARPTFVYAPYGRERSGAGRWVTLPGVGVMWTNDAESLELLGPSGVDDVASNEMRFAVHRLAREGVSAREAFDQLCSESGGNPVSGDLKYVPDPLD